MSVGVTSCSKGFLKNLRVTIKCSWRHFQYVGVYTCPRSALFPPAMWSQHIRTSLWVLLAWFLWRCNVRFSWCLPALCLPQGGPGIKVRFHTVDGSWTMLLKVWASPEAGPEPCPDPDQEPDQISVYMSTCSFYRTVSLESTKLKCIYLKIWLV